MPSNPSPKREETPHPEHDCPGCNMGKELMVGKYSSIVGQGAIHLPEGWVCMKYVSPKAYEAMRMVDAKRRPR